MSSTATLLIIYIVRSLVLTSSTVASSSVYSTQIPVMVSSSVAYCTLGFITVFTWVLSFLVVSG
jgi:hypothetical protein